MSKVTIQGDANGTGIFTIASPNSNTDRTLVLPDEAGTVLSSGTPLSSFPTGFANGITVADSWRLTVNKTLDGTLDANLERADEPSSGIVGSGMTESGGIFTFPSTGIYLVTCTGYFSIDAPDNTALDTQVSTDGGSNWNTFASAVGGLGSGIYQNSGTTFSMIDVTSTANVKVRFAASSLSSGSQVMGNSSENRTHFTFIRLGDT